MSDTPQPVPEIAEAEAEVEHAAADLEAASHPDAEKSTEELLAAAPPLVLPEGTNLIKHCTNCGLALLDAPSGIACPNCGTPLP